MEVPPPLPQAATIRQGTREKLAYRISDGLDIMALCDNRAGVSEWYSKLKSYCTVRFTVEVDETLPVDAVRVTTYDPGVVPGFEGICVPPVEFPPPHPTIAHKRTIERAVAIRSRRCRLERKSKKAIVKQTGPPPLPCAGYFRLADCAGVVPMTRFEEVEVVPEKLNEEGLKVQVGRSTELPVPENETEQVRDAVPEKPVAAVRLRFAEVDPPGDAMLSIEVIGEIVTSEAPVPVSATE